MNYLFCDERGQRISEGICENNFKTGKCKKDLFKCQRAREETKKKPEPEPTPKIVTEAANCGPLFAGLDNKGG